MVGRWIGSMPGSLALVARRGRWWRISWTFDPMRRVRRPDGRAGTDDAARRLHRFRYHLGRGRRAREAGQFERGAVEARRALAINAQDPWALALLGQCLYRQRAPDLDGARQALERAWSIEPTNGYFVRLLLDVLNTQGDVGACLDLLTWAWWRGAPVERWLPDGPPMPATERAISSRRIEGAEQRARPAASPAARRATSASPRLVGRIPAHA